MRPRIYFYANLGDLSKPGYGGGEEGNRRTLSILKSSEFETVIIPKYKRTTEVAPIRQFLLGVRMLLNLLNYIFILLFGRRRNSIVHIVGFYGVMVYWESLLVALASCFGYRIVYEMRGGGAESFYKSGKGFYRFIFDSIIKKSACIFSQGKENIPLLRQICEERDIYYYPNYLTAEFLPKFCPKKSTDTVKCIFFGRLAPTKHIETIIQTIKDLTENLDLPVHLQLVGDFGSDEYRDKILSLIASLGLEENVEIHAACTHNELASLLEDKNFYIFPSTEPREGHSNALTEAMAYGIVPIASGQGFNNSVIGNEELIISEITPEKISQIIIEIIKNGSFSKLSREMFERVQNLYSYDKNSKKFLDKYYQLFSHT